MHHVQQLILDQNLHCLAISETWLDAEVSDGEITIPGYTLLFLLLALAVEFVFLPTTELQSSRFKIFNTPILK